MAKPIKETPILKGKDAEAFIRNADSNSHVKISDDRKKEMNKNYGLFKKMIR